MPDAWKNINNQGFISAAHAYQLLFDIPKCRRFGCPKKYLDKLGIKPVVNQPSPAECKGIRKRSILYYNKEDVLNFKKQLEQKAAREKKEREKKIKDEEDRLHKLEQQFCVATKTLPQKNQDILHLRFGTYPYRPHTLQEIANYHNITRERVRQIIDTSLAKIEAKTGFKLNIPKQFWARKHPLFTTEGQNQ